MAWGTRSTEQEHDVDGRFNVEPYWSFVLKLSLPSWMSGVFVLLVLPFFFIGGPDAMSSVFVNRLWNFGHIIFFAVLMLLIQSYKPLTNWRAWLLVTVIAVALGCLIEFAQHFVGRNSNLDDVLHNLFGVWLGLFWGQKPTRLIWLLRALCLLLIAPAALLVVDAAIANLAMRGQFPVINSFDSRYELQQVHANPNIVETRQSGRVAADGEHSLEIIFSTRRYASFRLLGPYGDWSRYTYLTMDFYNPNDAPFMVLLKIADREHDLGNNRFDDRFNRRFYLNHGWNKIQIAINDIRTAPRKREMRMDDISGFTLFVDQLEQPQKLYWDNVRLE